MKSIGTYMFIFGLGSIILNFFNMEFRLLAWIDMWGTTIGWAIRIGLIVVGGALFLLGGSSDEAEEGAAS